MINGSVYFIHLLLFTNFKLRVIYKLPFVLEGNNVIKGNELWLVRTMKDLLLVS